MADGLMCPVPLCKLSANEKRFPNEDELRNHLQEAHTKSVEKNGLFDLIAFAHAHPGDWYLAGWREFDEREAQRIENEQPIKSQPRYIVLPIRTEAAN